MKAEFDKEVDALLKKAAISTVSRDAAGEHLTADEIAAFAENALPHSAKGVYLSHVSACDRCRRVLASVIAMNTPTGESVERSGAAVADPSALTWRASVFRFPNLAFAMGGLIVVFAGFLAFSIFQNSGKETAVRVSQIEDNRPQTGVQNAPADESPTASANTNASMAGPITQTGSAASNAAANASVTVASAPERDRSERTQPADVPTAATAPLKENRFTLDGNEAVVTADSAAAGARQSESPPAAKPTEGKDNAGEDAAVAAKKMESLPLSKSRDQLSLIRSSPEPKLDAQIGNTAAKRKSGPINNKAQSQLNTAVFDSRSGRNVAGRNFEFKQGVWYDSSFQGQSTTNVRRGSYAYKKLDAGLRSIADTLGGTVVIVWKSRAYRIQ